MAEFDGINVPEGIASILRKDREMTREFNTDPNFQLLLALL